ncbi:MAG TPA: SpoIID/LytB domain-containing protein [Spirochaetota bacterium]|nr:SpoIID/LytB domain-containing protein [Spirochaetota bacterium]HPP04325.1 SpoIID/LytB domain-containing protein [Spirochaetota bacterium]
MRKIFFVIIIILLFSCKTILEKSIENTKKSFEIRVLLKYAKDRVVLKSNSSLIIKDFITKKSLNVENNSCIEIFCKENKVFLNKMNILSPIIIYSKDNSLIKLNERYYAGYLKIVPEDGSFYIINYIPIETYLLSVLPSEVPVTFNIESMKTQAIAARTYAYYFLIKSSEMEFDVDDTVLYQVYNGFNPDFKKEEIKKIYKAVKETEGLIIKYKDEPIIAYFHSNSGGRITSGKEYFGESSDFPYLISKEDPYSVDMPGYKWDFEIDIKEFCNKLNIYNTNDIKIENFIYNQNGFVKEFNNETIVLTSKDIRRLIGYSNIKSEKFILNIKDNKIIITGYGRGHGVGLSQWGAENMARRKKNFKEIINFYYPETKIESF